MLIYELSVALHYGGPVLGGIICLLIGVVVTNRGWKQKIFRYAKAEIISTLEQQDNRIKQYEIDLQVAKDRIDMLEGIIKSTKRNALNIIGNIELDQKE